MNRIAKLHVTCLSLQSVFRDGCSPLSKKQRGSTNSAFSHACSEFEAFFFSRHLLILSRPFTRKAAEKMLFISTLTMKVQAGRWMGGHKDLRMAICMYICIGTPTSTLRIHSFVESREVKFSHWREVSSRTCILFVGHLAADSCPTLGAWLQPRTASRCRCHVRISVTWASGLDCAGHGSMENPCCYMHIQQITSTQ